MHIKPSEGRRLRTPDASKRLVPEEGIEVPDDDFYWQRRLAQGDAELVEKPAAEATEPQEPGLESTATAASAKPE